MPTLTRIRLMVKDEPQLVTFKDQDITTDFVRLDFLKDFNELIVEKVWFYYQPAFENNPSHYCLDLYIKPSELWKLQPQTVKVAHF